MHRVQSQAPIPFSVFLAEEPREAFVFRHGGVGILVVEHVHQASGVKLLSELFLLSSPAARVVEASLMTIDVRFDGIIIVSAPNELS
jgi:hypothetical protein